MEHAAAAGAWAGGGGGGCGGKGREGAKRGGWELCKFHLHIYTTASVRGSYLTQRGSISVLMAEVRLYTQLRVRSVPSNRIYISLWSHFNCAASPVISFRLSTSLSSEKFHFLARGRGKIVCTYFLNWYLTVKENTRHCIISLVFVASLMVFDYTKIGCGMLSCCGLCFPVQANTFCSWLSYSFMREQEDLGCCSNSSRTPDVSFGEKKIFPCIFMGSIG